MMDISGLNLVKKTTKRVETSLLNRQWLQGVLLTHTFTKEEDLTSGEDKIYNALYYLKTHHIKKYQLKGPFKSKEWCDSQYDLLMDKKS